MNRFYSIVELPRSSRRMLDRAWHRSRVEPNLAQGTELLNCFANATVRLKTITLALVVLAGMSVPNSSALGQSRGVVKSIESALNRGNVQKLLSHSADRVAVAVFGEAREYSQAQAEYVLKDFFKEHPVASFSFDDSSETERGMFIQGRLHYRGSNRPLRVFVRLQMKREKWELREIIIRK